MIRLVDVEVRRALSRRLVRVLVALAVLAIVVAGTIVFLTSDSEFDRDAALPEARAQLARDLAECRRFGGPEVRCEEVVGTVEDRVRDPRFHLTGVQDALLGSSSILFIAALAAAASFVGAEWRHGTMTTLLTWEPNRVRVLAAKAVAAALVAAPVAAALQALFVLAVLPAALLRGTTAGADATWWGDTVELGLRITGLTVFIALVGLAIATVGRNAGAALGVAFLWFGVLENIVRGLRPGLQRWLVGTNAATVLVGGLESPPVPGRTVAEAALYLAGCTAVALVAALAWFRRHDVV